MLKISFPVQRTLALSVADPSGETTVTVRQATYGQHAIRDALLADVTRVYTGDEMAVKANTNLGELMRKEAYLTLAGCNIQAEAADGSTAPLFRFKDENGQSRVAMTEAEFGKAWDLLPLAVAMEIHDRIIEVNPDWGPNAKG